MMSHWRFKGKEGLAIFHASFAWLSAFSVPPNIEAPIIARYNHGGVPGKKFSNDSISFVIKMMNAPGAFFFVSLPFFLM
jgi:hypothetical protein